MKLALFGTDLRYVDVEEADRIGLELLHRHVAPEFGNRPMPRRCRHGAIEERRWIRNHGVQRAEAIIKRQQRVPAEGDNDNLFLDRRNRRSRLSGAGGQIGGRGPLLPFGDGLLIDPVLLGQRLQALLTMLYRSTDCLCRGGAPM
ncbi:hypothetical protein X747_29040 [Mesorhizobium sp. LNJC384A00]|nr:hypothetical protein X766_09010 [Mesorhizobium sp. LSJC255A00]ESX78451.1 hypothetical protein X757_08225 [Mesorhizobium sp. LSHC414A00]ESY34676.1 hypothetical protein X747_29040 [Mesorhizobium sp. LNJC384A00]